PLHAPLPFPTRRSSDLRRPRAPRRPGPPRARPALARRVPLAAPTAPLGHPRSDDPPHLPHDADVLPVPAVLRAQRARGRFLRWDRRGDRARRALSRRWALRTRRGGPGAPRYPPGFGDEPRRYRRDRADAVRAVDPA